MLVKLFSLSSLLLFCAVSTHGADQFCSERENGNYPSTTNCWAFRTCSNGAETLKFCLPTLHFSPVTGHCELPAIAQCTVSNSHNDCGTGPIDCTDREHGELFPNPENCRSFYQCSHGVAYLHICPAGLFFNPAIKVCDWPQNVECNDDASRSTKCVTTERPPGTPETNATTQATTTRSTTQQATTSNPITTGKPTTTHKPTTTKPPTTQKPTTTKLTTTQKPTTTKLTTTQKPTTTKLTTTNKPTTTKSTTKNPKTTKSSHTTTKKSSRPPTSDSEEDSGSNSSANSDSAENSQSSVSDEQSNDSNNSD